MFVWFTMRLTEFFYADTVAGVHPLPVSWYLISSVCVYRCSWMQIMSILCSTADTVSSGSWPILFRVLTLNVAICVVCLHFSNFCLSSVVDFSNIQARAPASTGRTPFLPERRAMRFMYMVWVWVMVIFRCRNAYRTKSVKNNSIERIQPRMIAATFNGSPRTTIISCYSPIYVSEETELVTFYDELSSLVRSIPKHDVLVIGGDMNPQIGKNRNNKYSLHNSSNRNGQHLTDFMIENRLTCLNTNYQKREGKLWTYTYANNSKAQIDYVFINKKWKNSARNC